MAVPAGAINLRTGRRRRALQIAIANDGDVLDKAVATNKRLVRNTTACSTGRTATKPMTQPTLSYGHSNRFGAIGYGPT
jgi:hypothetical protein